MADEYVSYLTLSSLVVYLYGGSNGNDVLRGILLNEAVRISVIEDGQCRLLLQRLGQLKVLLANVPSDGGPLERAEGTALVEDAPEGLQAQMELLVAYQDLLLAEGSTAADVLADKLSPPFVLRLVEILCRRLDHLAVRVLRRHFAHKLEWVSLVDNLQFFCKGKKSLTSN